MEIVNNIHFIHFYSLIHYSLFSPNPKQKMSSISVTQAKENEVITIDDEEEQPKLVHWTTHMKVEKGKLMGKTIRHFKCNYCPKYYQGPQNSSLLIHLRKDHPKSAQIFCVKMNVPDLFHKATHKFNEDVFMGKLLKWIIQSDQAFSVVDDPNFEDMVEYLRKDVGVQSRRTIMRRLEDIYLHELKETLRRLNSKYSITFDVWTSKNQLSTAIEKQRVEVNNAREVSEEYVRS